jgi:hypothetical protein
MPFEGAVCVSSPLMLLPRLAAVHLPDHMNAMAGGLASPSDVPKKMFFQEKWPAIVGPSWDCSRVGGKRPLEEPKVLFCMPNRTNCILSPQ